MANPFTYINTSSRAHPIASTWLTGVACLLIGYTAKGVRDWYTRVPEAKMGITSIDTTIGDKNFDGIPDAMVTRSDGYNYFAAGRANETGYPDGTFVGVEGCAQEYRDIERSLNHSLTEAKKFIPPIRKFSCPPKPQPQSSQPASKFYDPNNNPAIHNPNEYHPKPAERTAQISSSKLENIAGSDVQPLAPLVRVIIPNQ